MVNMQLRKGNTEVETEVDPEFLVRVKHDGEVCYEEKCIPVDVIERYLAMPRDPNEIITDKYECYHVGEENAPRGMRGFGGAKFSWIYKDDGMSGSSTNLWFNGVVPACLRSVITPNVTDFKEVRHEVGE